MADVHLAIELSLILNRFTLNLVQKVTEMKLISWTLTLTVSDMVRESYRITCPNNISIIWSLELKKKKIGILPTRSSHLWFQNGQQPMRQMTLIRQFFISASKNTDIRQILLSHVASKMRNQFLAIFYGGHLGFRNGHQLMGQIYWIC